MAKYPIRVYSVSQPIQQQLEGIIKYLKPSYVSMMGGHSQHFGGFVLTTPSDDKGYISQYLISCLDGSEIEYFTDEDYFSLTDCQKGIQRNKIKSELNKLSEQERVNFFKNLELKYGFTDSNLGKVILVNKQGVKTQIIL